MDARAVKLLVVNADDLGYDPEIDRGILEAHARGIVTSATAMVLTPFAEAALRAAPASLGIGLHAVIDPGLGGDAAADALRRQLARFEELRGARPTHLDSHKHAHAAPEVLGAFAALALEEDLPVRAIDAPMRAALRAGGVLAADAFLGDASRRPAWTPGTLVTALAEVGEGVTELMAHPGHAPSHARTSFGVERERELEALCDPVARQTLDRLGIRLCSYAEARAHLRSGLAG
jgi:chitin disaccharide deacetylase